MKNLKGPQKVFERVLGVQGPICYGFLKALVELGIAKEVGKVRTSASGKGKPSTVYEVPQSFTVDLGALASANPSDVETVDTKEEAA